VCDFRLGRKPRPLGGTPGCPGREIVAKGGKIKPKKFKYKWQLNK